MGATAFCSDVWLLIEHRYSLHSPLSVSHNALLEVVYKQWSLIQRYIPSCTVLLLTQRSKRQEELGVIFLYMWEDFYHKHKHKNEYNVWINLYIYLMIYLSKPASRMFNNASGMTLSTAPRKSSVWIWLIIALYSWLCRTPSIGSSGQWVLLGRPHVQNFHSSNVLRM